MLLALGRCPVPPPAAGHEPVSRRLQALTRLFVLISSNGMEWKWNGMEWGGGMEATGLHRNARWCPAFVNLHRPGASSTPVESQPVSMPARHKPSAIRARQSSGAERLHQMPTPRVSAAVAIYLRHNDSAHSFASQSNVTGADAGTLGGSPVPTLIGDTANGVKCARRYSQTFSPAMFIHGGLSPSVERCPAQLKRCRRPCGSLGRRSIPQRGSSTAISPLTASAGAR